MESPIASNVLYGHLDAETAHPSIVICIWFPLCNLPLCSHLLTVVFLKLMWGVLEDILNLKVNEFKWNNQPSHLIKWLYNEEWRREFTQKSRRNLFKLKFFNIRKSITSSLIIEKVRFFDIWTSFWTAVWPSINLLFFASLCVLRCKLCLKLVYLAFNWLFYTFYLTSVNQNWFKYRCQSSFESWYTNTSEIPNVMEYFLF